MSRADYIWLVQTEDGHVLAAFTVKYEMVTYLERLGVVADLTVVRLRDGQPFKPQKSYQAKELLGWD